MKVIVDLFPLGEDIKTGVSRVAEHLCLGLASNLGKNVSFHATIAIPGSSKYFDEKIKVFGSELANRRITTTAAKIIEISDSFISDSLEKRAIYYKIARKVVFTLSSLIKNYLCELPDSSTRECDIYHSSFSSIGKKIIKNRKIIRFTTIYDLIPITNPNFFEDPVVNTLHNVVDNLTEEDYTMCISNYTRSILLENSRCAPSRCFVNPLAASEKFYPVCDNSVLKSVMQRYGIYDNKFILSLCTFEVRKNLEIVIECFCDLHNAGAIPDNIKLVLVGGRGWKTHNIEFALSAAGVHREKIIIPGFIPDEDLAAIYSNARVFVYMSLLEGFGLPPLEAMQCGIPVITSDTSSLPEVVGSAGVMLKPKDKAGIFSAVARMYNDDDFHALMAAKAIERSKLFSWNKFIENTLDYYKFALATNNKKFD